ncbi:MAG: hypothetical protein JWQ98_587 [Chlorobi bacterium]|nr:hypothetical protein [Chlorobiota bacterium]
MKLIYTRFAVAIACIGMFVGSTAFKSANKTISLHNKCTFAIHQVFLSPVSEDKWGDDILDKDEVLKPGESVDIEIDCGQWDAKLVAEDGSTCVVHDVNICAADIWEVTADCGQ